MQKIGMFQYICTLIIDLKHLSTYRSEMCDGGQKKTCPPYYILTHSRRASVEGEHTGSPLRYFTETEFEFLHLDSK